jgi:hypothetical protein
VGELGLGHILEQESARSGLQRLEEVLVRVKAGQDYDPGAEQSVEERDLLQFYPAGPGFAFFGELAGDEAAQLRNVGWQAQSRARSLIRRGRHCDRAADRGDLAVIARHGADRGARRIL